MPVIVNTGSSRAVVVDRERTASIVQHRPTVAAVADRRSTTAVAREVQTLQVASPGPQGAKGAPGASASGALPPINFAFGDATPAVVLVFEVASEVMAVSLQIEEAFDGVGVQIQLGTAAAPGLLIDGWQSDPSAATTFEVSPREEIAAGTAIILTITPGAGATQGQGQFVITAVPTA